MRTLSGYFIISILFPLLIGTVFYATQETKKAKSLDTILEDIHVEETNLKQKSLILAGNGSIATELYNPENRVFLPFEQIPAFLKDIFIVSEDQNFYEHPGFDLTAIGRALTVNIKEDGIEQGASTITQQVARNLYLSHNKTYNRKLSEILYAYQLERTFSKDQILELYINAIYFQNGAYGIEAAAGFYFNKNTAQLTKGELAFLAAIPNNPSYYDPIEHFDHTKLRQERLIGLLQHSGLIGGSEAEQIKGEPIVLHIKKRVDQFPDYTAYVEDELHRLVAQQDGYDARFAEASEQEQAILEEELAAKVDDLLSSGIIIHTALDAGIQEKTVQAVQNHLGNIDAQGAAAVIRHRDMEIIALSGGKNYQKYDFHRAYQAYRQPGSAIKPLLVYAPYFERTKASASENVDAGRYCNKNYCPENYDGATYGRVPIEQAFIHSYNTPAVRLLDKIGIQEGFADIDHFHFKQVVSDDHVLPAAVGGFTYGMTPLELTGAYTVFPNGGHYRTPRTIRKITDRNGKILYAWNDQPVQIWSQQTIETVDQLLQKTLSSGTARKAYLPNRAAGGKTGTTNHFKDLWFVGYADDLTAGVWVGKDQPESIESLQNQAPQLMIWRDIVK
ncbi:transglycosylase domain-containing protein [Bacillus sp. V33-4]|uniref:transglycosylase domain-containing protein n=1 Tax=Bacillus sp. V33-4 TaxID=2054169 RepID=UPI000C789DA2|nr:transglycosylase domain-containing protein [Bacillus sp. V33-4]PLR85194.1 penicillin-binding protein [Bacillus sp. V33-4]